RSRGGFLRGGLRLRGGRFRSRWFRGGRFCGRRFGGRGLGGFRDRRGLRRRFPGWRFRDGCFHRGRSLGGGAAAGPLRRREAARRALTAADAPAVLDEGRERLAQVFRVLIGKIDIVVDAVKGEPHSLLGRFTVEV